jgi:predicted metal-binding membrane protein
MSPGAPLRREQLSIVATLAVLTVLAWAVTLFQMGDMASAGMAMGSPPAIDPAHDGMPMGGMVSSADTGHGGMQMGGAAPSASMGQNPPTADEVTVLEPGNRLILYLGMWTTMMAAMMLPAAAPMILVFATISRKQRERGDAFVPTWVFVAGYLAMWAAFGACAWALGETGSRLARVYPMLSEIGPRVAAAAMMAAALYQLTPLKERCLALCRSPLSFVLNHWQPGMAGAWKMGLEHGRYCVGCCWVLFVLLVAVGLASLPWMGLITLIIIGEKLLPGGRAVTLGVAALLFGLGVVTLLRPDLLALTTA